MRLIGITGSSGSGKSTVSDYYASLGYTVIDGDGISRQLAVPGSAYVQALCQEFGKDICDENGYLQRRKMAQIAFADKAAQKRLTEITAPLIMQEVCRQIKACAEKGQLMAFLDGALILGTPFADLCDKIIAVLANREVQIERIMARDGVEKHTAIDRLDRQWSNLQMEKSADICIYNTQDKEELLCTAKKILSELKVSAE